MAWRRFFVSFFMLGVFSQSSCYLRDQPIFVEYRRPENVPPDAIYVPGGKGGYWKRCTHENQGSPRVHCQVYNWGGGKLWDEEFLPYDGRSPVSEEELRIKKNPRAPIDNEIELENGRILLPKSRFDQLKRFLDRLK